MEEEWRSEELRTFRAWLDEHGYKPHGAGAPQYGVAERNGELAFKSVAESWKERDRVAVINLLFDHRGNTQWKVYIHREKDGKILNRLHLNEARRLEVESGEVAGKGLCDFLVWCPSWCDMCIGFCAAITGGSLLKEWGACIALGYGLFGPIAGTVLAGVCILFTTYGAGWMAFNGCPFVCDEVGAC